MSHDFVERNPVSTAVFVIILLTLGYKNVDMTKESNMKVGIYAAQAALLLIIFFFTAAVV